MTSSPCIKRCVCWEFLDKRCGNVSSAARSKLFTSDADAKKACASRSSALNPTSSIKLHKLGCSMKHHPSSPQGWRPRLPGGRGIAALPPRPPPVGHCAQDGTRTVLVGGRLQRSVPAPASLLSCSTDHAGSRCPTA